MFATPQDVAAQWREELNEPQRVAVEHGDGPLLVIAGAGSGKTRTLAGRVANLIEGGVRPDRILLLTFTRRAAAEMLRRAGGMIADRSAARVWGGTFHATAHRLLRHHGAAVGLHDGFTILDQSDSESLFGLLRTELGVASTGERFPRQETIAAIYSRSVNAQTKLTDTLDSRFPWCRDHTAALKELFGAYTARKHEHNVLDYDDLLLYMRALIESPAAGTLRKMFDHVLVDEYQDTNRIQADILMGLCGPGGNLTVVGDDAQAIYSFRASTVENILDFPSEYPGAAVVQLEQNYRSTPQVLAAANAVISESTELFPKRLWSARPDGARPRLVTCFDEAAQADYVCDQVLELREQGTNLKDQAVLFRTGHHSDGLELELSRRRIPFVKYGGLKFLEAAHIKDLLAALRLLDNPKDELAWHRVLRMVPGIGPATAARIMDDLGEAAAAAGSDELHEFIHAELKVAAQGRAPLRELTAALSDCGSAGDTLGTAAQIDRLIGFFRMVFEHGYDDAAARLADIETLRALAADSPTRSQFLADLALDPPNSTSDLAQPPHLDDDYLVLSTIHSAKGVEWDAVYLIHAADGNLPSDMALSEPDGVEEERRIMYVALTRARNELHVTFPQRFYHRRRGMDGAHSYGLPSRFLSTSRAHFDEVSVGAGYTDDAAATAESGDSNPVDRVLEALWE
jgi:DNA helicase-2/ATP-dependent DNA helicase PcrA